MRCISALDEIGEILRLVAELAKVGDVGLKIMANQDYVAFRVGRCKFILVVIRFWSLSLRGRVRGRSRKGRLKALCDGMGRIFEPNPLTFSDAWSDDGGCQ